jgi:hypothetical protein
LKKIPLTRNLSPPAIPPTPIGCFQMKKKEKHINEKGEKKKKKENGFSGVDCNSKKRERKGWKKRGNGDG